MTDTDIAALVKRLRKRHVNDHPQSIGPSIFTMAADALEACQAENERQREILTAIAEGCPTLAKQDRFVVVENPRYTPDNGEAPNLVWDGGKDD